MPKRVTGKSGAAAGRAKIIVRMAEGVENPLEKLASTCYTSSAGTSFSLHHTTPAQMSQETKDWAFALLKTNMEALYNTSWGWDDAKKRSELLHKAARFVMVFPGDVPAAGAGGEAVAPVAYVHYRFEVDEGAAVIYVYEIQVDEKGQRQGLGKFLMDVVEQIGAVTNMQKTMLTVFDANVGAMKFYRHHCNYDLDATSPDACGDTTKGYKILSKKIQAAA